MAVFHFRRSCPPQTRPGKRSIGFLFRNAPCRFWPGCGHEVFSSRPFKGSKTQCHSSAANPVERYISLAVVLSLQSGMATLGGFPASGFRLRNHSVEACLAASALSPRKSCNKHNAPAHGQLTCRTRVRNKMPTCSALRGTLPFPLRFARELFFSILCLLL